MSASSKKKRDKKMSGLRFTCKQVKLLVIGK
jgi:hypothetical protein